MKIFSYLFKPLVMFCTFSSINPYLNAKIALIPGFQDFELETLC